MPTPPNPADCARINVTVQLGNLCPGLLPLALIHIWPALRHLGVAGMAPLPGLILLARELPPCPSTDTLLRHERIHHRQQLECLVLPFYLLYLLDYLAQRLRGHSHWDAYYRISFEQEAHAHEAEPDYLARRPWFQWLRYVQ